MFNMDSLKDFGAKARAHLSNIDTDGIRERALAIKNRAVEAASDGYDSIMERMKTPSDAYDQGVEALATILEEVGYDKDEIAISVATAKEVSPYND